MSDSRVPRSNRYHSGKPRGLERPQESARDPFGPELRKQARTNPELARIIAEYDGSTK